METSKAETKYGRQNSAPSTRLGPIEREGAYEIIDIEL